jgi:hypothetical protein
LLASYSLSGNHYYASFFPSKLAPPPPLPLIAQAKAARKNRREYK